MVRTASFFIAIAIIRKTADVTSKVNELACGRPYIGCVERRGENFGRK